MSKLAVDNSANNHPTPQTYHNLDLTKLKVRKVGYPIGDHIHLHEISYQRKPLILQTPKYYLPFGVSKSYQSNGGTEKEREKYHIDHSIKKTTTEDPFPNFLQELDRVILEQLNRYKMKGQSETITLAPSLRQSEDSYYPPKLRTKIDSQIPLQVYDIYGAPQRQDYIVPGSWAKSLIYLKNVWYSTKTNEGGLTWYILQTKVETPVPILNKCLIEDESWDGERLCSICYSKILKATPQAQAQSSTLSSVQTPAHHLASTSVPPPPPPPLPKGSLLGASVTTGYEKYFKMLKLGIPLVAVIQKCQMDGLDPIYLTSKDRTPPPLPQKVGTSLPFSANDLLATRKKLANAEDRTLEGKMTLNLKPRDPRVPSLNMVLRRLTSLRKTERREKLLAQESEKAKEYGQ